MVRTDYLSHSPTLQQSHLDCVMMYQSHLDCVMMYQSHRLPSHLVCVMMYQSHRLPSHLDCVMMYQMMQVPACRHLMQPRTIVCMSMLAPPRIYNHLKTIPWVVCLGSS